MFHSSSRSNSRRRNSQPCTSPALENLESRQLLTTGLGLASVMPADAVAIPAFLNAADADSSPTDQLSGDSETRPAAEDTTEKPGEIAGERSSVAIPAFAVAESDNTRGLTSKDREDFNAAVQRDDWAIVGNPSLRTESGGTRLTTQAHGRPEHSLSADSVTFPIADAVTAGETYDPGQAGNWNGIVSCGSSFPVSAEAAGDREAGTVERSGVAIPAFAITKSADVQGLTENHRGVFDAAPNEAQTSVDTSRYEELARGQQDEIIAIIACIEAGDVNHHTNMNPSDFDAAENRDGWIIAGNPSLESSAGTSRYVQFKDQLRHDAVDIHSNTDAAFVGFDMPV